MESHSLDLDRIFLATIMVKTDAVERPTFAAFLLLSQFLFHPILAEMLIALNLFALKWRSALA